MKRCLILFFLFSLNLSGKPDLPQPLEFDYQDVPMRLVLEDLSERIGIRFVFYDQLVENRSVFCRFSSASVSSILNRIILPQGLLYEETSENTITLFRRTVPPHTWILQGQILSGDSAGIADAAVYLTELSIGMLTDAQGCFVFMDVPVSPCLIRISRKGFESLQRSVDSTQAYQLIVLRPEPVEGLRIDPADSPVRTAEKRASALYLPHREMHSGPARVWPPASFLFRTGTPFSGLRSPMNQGADPFSCSGMILYDGIPWVVNACRFEVSGFHSMNTGNIQPGSGRDGYPVFCERYDIPLTESRSVSGSMEVTPWQVSGRFFLTKIPALNIFVAAGQSYFLSTFQGFYDAWEDYQQLARYRSIRPARSPLYRHTDFSSKIGWNAGSAGRFSLTVLHIRDRLNTGFSDAAPDPETLTDQTTQTGARLAWHHEWSAGARSGAEAVFTENRDRYRYHNSQFLTGNFTDRAEFSTGYARVTHLQPVYSWWQIQMTGGYAQTKSVHRIDADGQMLDKLKSGRTVFYAAAKQSMNPSVLLQGVFDTELRYDPAIPAAIMNSSLVLRYRLRQSVTMAAEWAENQTDWHSVPNQYLTEQPWRIRTFRLAAGSAYPAEKIRHWSLSVESAGRHSVKAALFYDELANLMIAAGSSGSVPGADNDLFLTGSGTVSGAWFEAELKGKLFDFWLSYRWAKNSHRFQSLNGSRSFVPEWHRDHSIQGVMQTSLLNLNTRVTGIWASGAAFIERPPVYQMTAYGPDYRLSLPSESWNIEYSRPCLRMDCSVSKSVALRGAELTLQAAVINLLNRLNVIGPYYFIEPAEADAELPQTFLNMPDLPRTAYFSVSVRLFR